MKFKLCQEVGEGGLIPKWYGVAYRCPNKLAYVCYPIPLNFLIALLIKIKWFLKVPVALVSNKRVVWKRENLNLVFWQMYHWGICDERKNKPIENKNRFYREYSSRYN